MTPQEGLRRCLCCVPAVLLLLGAAAEARSSEVLHLGCTLPLTGLQRSSAELYRRAYDLAVEWINGKGGVTVGGRSLPIRLTCRDDGGEPARAARETEQLIVADRVDFLVGPFGAGAAEAAAQVAERHRVPLVQAAAESAGLYGRGYRYLFGMLPAPSTFLSPLAALMGRLSPRPRSLALAWADDAFDDEAARAFKATAQAAGLSVVLAESYPAGSRNLSELVGRLAALRPDAVVVAGHDEEARLFVRQARERDLNPPFLAFTAGVTDPGFRKTLGADAEQLFGVTAWHPALDLKGEVFGSAAEFARLWGKAYQGEVPDFHAAAAAASVVALAEAVRSAGSLDPRAVRDALARLAADTFYGRVAFNPGGQLEQGTFVVQVQGGELVQVAPPAGREPVYPALPWKERRLPPGREERGEPNHLGG